MPILTELNSGSTLVNRGLSLTNPRNAALEDGRQVVIWQTASNELYARQVSENGVPMGSARIVSFGVSKNDAPNVATLSDGSYLIVYTKTTLAGHREVFGTRYSDTGTKIGNETRLLADASEAMFAPTITPLSDGGFAIGAVGYSASDQDFSSFVRSFDLDMRARGNMAQVEIFKTGRQVFPEVVGTQDGGFAAIWTSDVGDGAGTAIMMRLVNANGVPQGREIRVNAYTSGDQNDPAVTQLSDGSLIIVWSSAGQDGSEGSIIGRHFSAQGVPLGPEFLVNETRAGNQQLPSVTALNDGGFVVAWTHLDSRPDTMARQYDNNSQPVTGEVTISHRSLNRDLGPEVVSLSNGGVGFVWMDISASGFTPVLGAEVRTTLPSMSNSTEGDDVIVDGDADTLIFALGGNDWIIPGTGSDTIDGGTGTDMISFIDHVQAVRVDLAAGRATSGMDTNTLTNIEGVTGTSRADYIVGDDGNNRLRGAGDYDWFVGSNGADTYDGGEARDMVSYASSTSGVNVDLTTGRGSAGLAAGDRYQNIERVTGSSHADVLKGDAGDNDLRGLGDYDWFLGTAGRDRYEGGSGLDMISYAESSSAVSVDLAQGRGTRGDAARDSYVSVERVTGSSYDDHLVGDSGNNLLRGLYGEDTLYGGAGVDRLIGGASDDYLDGGFGWDYAIFNGARDDYNVSRNGGKVLVEHLASGREGTDTLVNIEVIQFSDDLLYL